MLQDTDIDEVPRSRAAKILGLIESGDAVEPLIAALKDESVVVRSEAATALGVIADTRAAVPLVGALEDGNEWVTVRANAVTALQQIKDERSVEPLIDALESDITAIRSNAVVALGPLMDKRATMPLIQILEDETADDAIRGDAITSLTSIADSRAADAIMEAMNDDSIAIKQKAALALGSLVVSDAVQLLMNIVRDVNQPVALRTNAAEALGEIGDERALPLLKERLADRNEFDASWDQIAIAVGLMKGKQLPPLVAERAYDTWEPAAVRSAAFKALVPSEGDFDKLVEMLGDGTVAVRSGAVIALGETGRKEATQLLVDKMYGDKRDGEEAVRRDAAKGLASLADPASEQALIEAHKSDADSVKIESALALGNIKGDAGIQALIDTLNDTGKAKSVRANAAKALGESGSTKAVPDLRKALKDNVAIVHFEAAEALRKITGEDVGYQR